MNVNSHLLQVKPMSERQDISVWQSELELLINQIKTVSTTSQAFAIKLQLEGYLLCALSAKLIDNHQFAEYTQKINQILTSRLF